nr:MAG TPA: hypothetical protein [Caudoviricetes sp.]
MHPRWICSELSPVWTGSYCCDHHKIYKKVKIIFSIKVTQNLFIRYVFSQITQHFIVLYFRF